MSNIEQNNPSLSSTKSGMALAEYNMLRDKALRGEMLIVSDQDGNIIEVPAREQYLKLYGDDLSQASAIPTVSTTETATLPVEESDIVSESSVATTSLSQTEAGTVSDTVSSISSQKEQGNEGLGTSFFAGIIPDGAVAPSEPIPAPEQSKAPDAASDAFTSPSVPLES